MRDPRATPDVLIAGIAAERHGIVRTDHLRAVGLDKHAVARRVRSGRLHPKYPGVYGLGHGGLSQEGEWLAAVDACRPNAFLNCLACACVWDLLKWEEDWLIDVTIMGTGGRKSKTGIRIHHSRTLSRRDITERTGIPVTNVPRLLRDLAVSAPPEIYRRVLREAEFKGHKKGLPKGYVPNRSDFELMFIAFCDRHGLPRPKTRVKIGPHEADFLFEDAGLFIETDSWSAHRGQVAFESDHERDLWMKVNGYEFLRLTWRQVTETPVETAAALRVILAR